MNFRLRLLGQIIFLVLGLALPGYQVVRLHQATDEASLSLHELHHSVGELAKVEQELDNLYLEYRFEDETFDEFLDRMMENPADRWQDRLGANLACDTKHIVAGCVCDE